jgi:hypothetical protein
MKNNPAIKAAADVDDTVLEKNPNFGPDFLEGGIAYVELQGRPIALNPGFVPTGDTLVNLREAFGTLQDNGEPWGRFWDHQCKRTREISFEHHLKLQFEDVLQSITIEEAIEFAIRTMQPMCCSAEFFAGLQERNISVAFVTNGADIIAGPVLKHFFGSVLDGFTLHANYLRRDGIFLGANGSVGVAKDLVVKSLGNVQFFLGDSKGGDGPGAQAVYDRGGFVFAFGHNGLSAYCQDHFQPDRWCHLENYTGALAIVDRHLSLRTN